MRYGVAGVGVIDGDLLLSVLGVSRRGQSAAVGQDRLADHSQCVAVSDLFRGKLCEELGRRPARHARAREEEEDGGRAGDPREIDRASERGRELDRGDDGAAQVIGGAVVDRPHEVRRQDGGVVGQERSSTGSSYRPGGARRGARTGRGVASNRRDTSPGP